MPQADQLDNELTVLENLVIYARYFDISRTMIVLTNKSGETMRKSLNRATEIGLGLKDSQPPTPVPVTPVTSSEMNEYVGTFSHAPQAWEVSVKDGKLYVKADDKEYPLTKSGERKFTYGAQNENEIVFVPGKERENRVFIYRTLRREEDKVIV